MTDAPAITQERDGWSRVPHWLLTKVKPQSVVVYAALAQWADLPGGARPRIRRLAEDLNVSDTTIKRAIRELADAGALTVEHRHIDGQQIASRYYLRVSIPAGGGVTVDPPRGGADDPPGGSQMTYQESDSVQSDSGSQTQRADAQESTSDFDAWYARYPRKRSKPSAANAYKRALKKATAEEIDAGLDRHLAHWQRKGTAPEYVPYPATWLNGEQWADELEQAAPATDAAPVRIADRWEYPAEVVGDSARERAYRASIGLDW